MKAVVLTRTGGPEVLQVLERPAPVVAAGEVRIAVHAAGLNFVDTMARVGLYPDAPKPPCVLGYEVAGEVESIGEGVSGLAVGERVMAGTPFGGQTGSGHVLLVGDQFDSIQTRHRTRPLPKWPGGS